MARSRSIAVKVCALLLGLLVGCEPGVSRGEIPCLLEFEKTDVTLRADGPGSAPDPRPPVARDVVGRFYTWTYTPGVIAEWSEDGGFIRTIGGYGEGPGELQGGILTTRVDEDGGIHVLDTATGRWSRFTPSGEFTGSGASIFLRPATGSDVALIGRDSLLVGYPIFSQSHHQFHIIDGSGTVQAEFGALPGDLGVDFPPARAVAYDGGSTFWAAPLAGGLPDGYVLEEWTFDGTLRGTFRRDVPWFPVRPTGEVSPESGREYVRFPQVEIYAVNNGLLLSRVVLRLPEEDSGASGEAWFELIDPATSEVLASKRVLFDDPEALPILSVFPRTDLGYVVRTDESGFQYIDVVRFFLTPNPVATEVQEQRCA